MNGGCYSYLYMKSDKSKSIRDWSDENNKQLQGSKIIGLRSNMQLCTFAKVVGHRFNAPKERKYKLEFSRLFIHADHKFSSWWYRAKLSGLGQEFCCLLRMYTGNE